MREYSTETFSRGADCKQMSPFTAFCLYVAARIFVHLYKKQPQNNVMRGNLEFLLNSMQAGQRKNPLANSFLVQIMVDLDGLELDVYQLNSPRAPFGNQMGLVRLCVSPDLARR